MGVTVVCAFQNILENSMRKPNKIWVDKVSGFYKRSMKSLKDHDRNIFNKQ